MGKSSDAVIALAHEAPLRSLDQRENIPAAEQALVFPPWLGGLNRSRSPSLLLCKAFSKQASADKLLIRREGEGEKDQDFSPNLQVYLLCLQGELDKNLLQFFVDKIDAKLLKTIFLKSKTNRGKINVRLTYLPLSLPH